MKISNAGPQAGPGQPTHSASRSTNSDFARRVEMRPAAARSVGPAMPLAVVDGVLAIQEVPDAAADRRRAVRRGHALLDELDELRLGLIDGRLSEATLRRLAALLEATEPSPDDPKLASVLDQIELRATLEMVKLRDGRG